MGFFDRFNRFSSKSVASQLPGKTLQEESQGTLAGLNLKQVMEAHNAWKSKLQQVLDGKSTEKLDIAMVSADCNCFLGKWIYGEGKTLYGHLREYEDVRQAHAEFHLHAGEVLTQHLLGNQEESERILNTKFRSASNRNQLQLVRLFTAAKR
jgi:hypothetical protein